MDEITPQKFARRRWEKSELRHHSDTDRVRYAKTVLYDEDPLALYDGDIQADIGFLQEDIRTGEDRFETQFLILLLQAQRDYEVRQKTYRKEEIEHLDVQIAAAEEMLDLAAAPEPGEPEVEQKTFPTVAAKIECQKWIKKQAALGVLRKKDEMFRDAKNAFGGRLNRRSFDLAWEEAAPADWKKPGRRPDRESTEL